MVEANLTLQAKVTCPHCWHQYAPEDSLWVSEHPDLLGDPKLGFQFAKRFLPSRFSVEGDALDEENHKSTRMACPHCHLEVPRPLYQLNNVFFSILGAPACGKSYFLASLTWGLRQTCRRRRKRSDPFAQRSLQRDFGTLTQAHTSDSTALSMDRLLGSRLSRQDQPSH